MSRRLPLDELFPGGRLEAIGDTTLTRRLNEAEMLALGRQADPPEAIAFLEQRDADIMFNALANPHGLTPRQRRRALAFVGLSQSGNEPL